MVRPLSMSPPTRLPSDLSFERGSDTKESEVKEVSVSGDPAVRFAPFEKALHSERPPFRGAQSKLEPPLQIGWV